MSGANETAGKHISYLPANNPLNATVKAALVKTFGDDDINTLASSIPVPVEILDRVSAALPSQDNEWLNIAMAMINGLRAMGYGVTPQPATATPTTPQRVVVEMPKRPQDLSTRELLGALASGEGDVNELLVCLTNKADVTHAARCTEGRFAVLTKDGAFDPQGTYDYITRLNRAFGTVERLVNDKAPVTIDRALKRSEMVTVNPYLGTVEYVGVANSYGITMSTVSDQRYQAIAWAVRTGHRFLPRTTDDEFDLIRYHEELFTPNGPRGMRIEEDYRLALEAGDATTLVTAPRQMTEAQALEIIGEASNGSSGSTMRANQPTKSTDWEEVVRRHFAKRAELQSTSLTITGYNKTVAGQYTSVTIAAYNVRVDNAVVIDRLILTEYNIRGTVIMPPHCAPVDRGYNNNVRVINKTWEQIAEMIGARP
jgi:hypothetical protein